MSENQSSGKPETQPTWTTNQFADIIEPTAGEKAIGNQAGTRPPAHWENWRANNVYRWLRHIGLVPTANLVLRNAAPVSTPFRDDVVSANTLITLMNVFPGLGENKFVGAGAPADKYDEWWLGTSDGNAPGAARLWRMTAGLGSGGEGILNGNSFIADDSPRLVIRDDINYILFGEDTGDVKSETSVAGVVWINPQTINATDSFKGAAWNEKTGGSKLIVSVLGGGPTTAVTADPTGAWAAPVFINGFLSTASAIAYSAVLDLFCIVGLGTGGFGVITSANGSTWARATGFAGSHSWNAVTVLPDGEFLIVGDDGAINPIESLGTMAIGSGTTFTEIEIRPNTNSFEHVAVQDRRVIATGRDGLEFNPIVESKEGLATYDAFMNEFDVLSTWKRSGQLVTPLPARFTQVVPGNLDGLSSGEFMVPMAVTDAETVFVGAMLGDGVADVLISEAHHPLGD